MTAIVYGASCSWWGPANAAGTRPSGLPCCPRCHGALYEMSEGEWWSGVDRKVSVDDPIYREFIEWLKGRCHRGPNYFENARAIFDAERAEHVTRAAEMAAQSFDTGKPGLSPYRSVDLTGVRQLAGHLISSSALHSASKGWIPTIFVSLDTVPLTGAGKRERMTFVCDLDAAQEFIDIFITGLERAIADADADADYGLREA